MKRKVVALVLVMQVLALSVFTGCGKEKLVQDKGVASSEMTTEDIEFLKYFYLEPEDISKHFTNLIVTTPDGSYDMLTETMDVLENKGNYISEVHEDVYHEFENFTISQIQQPFRLDDYTVVGTADAYLNEEKDKRIFSYLNVQYQVFGEIGDGDASVMGITNTTDLKSIQNLFGEPHDIIEPEGLWYTAYKYIVSMNGMPMEVTIKWNNDEDTLETFEIISYCIHYSYYMEEDMDLSELERFYKNK